MGKIKTGFNKFMSSPSSPDTRVQGVIKKWYPDAGQEFGFIAVRGEVQMYFFHLSYFESKVDASALTRGMTVEFTPNDGPKGKRAFNITLPVTDGVVQEEEEEVTPAVLANDMTQFIELRVRSSTPAKDLAGSIVHNIMNGKNVKLMAIGHGAVAQAVKAVPIASGKTIGNGYALAIIPSFEVKTIQTAQLESTERTLTVMQVIKIRPM